MPADAKTVARRWFEELWNQSRVGVIDELMAPNVAVHGLGETVTGREAFKAFYASYRNAFPDIRFQIEDLIAEGDKVAIRWTATATHRGNGLGFAATNRRVTFSGMGTARMQNGQLVDAWNTLDQLGMLQQLGIVTLPKA